MNAEIVNRLNKLPDNLRDSSLSDKSSAAISLIRERYLSDDRDKLDKFKDIVGLTYLKDAKIEQLPLILKEALGFDEKTAAEVALVVLCEMFYPVKDFYPGVEEEIVKLGGEIPKGVVPEKITQQYTNREEAIEEMIDKQHEEEEEKKKDEIVYAKIADLIAQHPELGDAIIGMQSSIAVKNMPDMKPMIKYWIQDYQNKVGVYHDHSNLDRVQYVCHDKNTRNMNDEERRQLNLVLKSVDGEIDLPYSAKMKKIDFSLIEEE